MIAGSPNIEPTPTTFPNSKYRHRRSAAQHAPNIGVELSGWFGGKKVGEPLVNKIECQLPLEI
jgi:hypothetical protein